MSERLTNSAIMLQGMGFSVIPTRTDSPKVSAIEWKQFQQRRATVDEIQQWSAFGGIAVVCGLISNNLIVIDFDSPELEEQFNRRFSSLLQTRTIRTANRQCHHYYYYVDVSPPSRAYDGVDLLSTGKYAVTAPTVIGDSEYKIVRGGMPKKLNEAELEAVLQWLESTSAPTPERKPVTIDSTHTQRYTTPEELISLYEARSASGRNNALFITALYARDHRMSQDSTIATLADLHARTMADDREYIQRHTEALKTISSAYSRAPRTRPSYGARQLWNVIREELNRRKMTIAARCLDALRIAGVDGGQYFTTADIARALGVRSDSYQATQSVKQIKELDNMVILSPCTKSIFSTIQVDYRKLNPVGMQGILKGKKYRMPTDSELCEMLGIAKNRASDGFTEEQIQSIRPSEYRRILLEEFITRRPGKYSHAVIQYKTGTSTRTIQRYNNRTERYTTVPSYSRKQIFYHNLDEIPQDVESKADSIERYAGMYLEIEAKAYPLITKIAVDALGRGETVYLMRRLANEYKAIKQESAVTKQPENIANNATSEASRRAAMWQAAREFYESPQIIFSEPERIIIDLPTPEPPPVNIPENIPAKKPRKPKAINYTRKLKNTYAEETAQLIYSEINSEQKRVSIQTLRKLVTLTTPEIMRRAWYKTVNRSPVDCVKYFSTIMRVEVKRIEMRTVIQ